MIGRRVRCTLGENVNVGKTLTSDSRYVNVDGSEGPTWFGPEWTITDEPYDWERSGVVLLGRNGDVALNVVGSWLIVGRCISYTADQMLARLGGSVTVIHDPDEKNERPLYKGHAHFKDVALPWEFRSAVEETQVQGGTGYVDGCTVCWNPDAQTPVTGCTLDAGDPAWGSALREYKDQMNRRAPRVATEGER